MKYSILVFIIALSFNGFGQCKFDIDKVDKFEGDTLLATKDAWIHSNMQGGHSVSFMKFNSTYALKFYKASTSLKSLLVKEGDKLIFLMDDGTKVEFISPETKTTKFLANSAGQSSKVSVVYPMTKDQLEIFASKEIAEFRFQAGDRNYDELVKNAKKKSKVKASANCLLDR